MEECSTQERPDRGEGRGSTRWSKARLGGKPKRSHDSNLGSGLPKAPETPARGWRKASSGEGGSPSRGQKSEASAVGVASARDWAVLAGGAARTSLYLQHTPAP